ncbi:MAG: hypothetical protein AAGJ93_02845 [Bacteroidota bacterium]
MSSHILGWIRDGEKENRLISVKLLGLGILSMLYFTGCNIDSIDEPIIIPFVEQEFIFDLWENLSTTTGSALEIRMYTIEEGECLNTSILSSYTRDELELQLTLFEILYPENCDPGTAPAVGQEAINDIGFGLYDLKVDLQGLVTYKGQLNSTSLSYTVNMEEENSIQWSHDELLKVPNGALWGYLTYTEDEGLSKAEAFLTNLEEISDVSNANDGYYGHFELSEDGDILKINGMPEEGNQLPFIYRYQGEKMTIDQMVSELRENSPAGLELVLRDQKGNEY